MDHFRLGTKNTSSRLAEICMQNYLRTCASIWRSLPPPLPMGSIAEPGHTCSSLQANDLRIDASPQLCKQFSHAWKTNMPGPHLARLGTCNHANLSPREHSSHALNGTTKLPMARADKCERTCFEQRQDPPSVTSMPTTLPPPRCNTRLNIATPPLAKQLKRLKQHSHTGVPPILHLPPTLHPTRGSTQGAWLSLQTCAQPIRPRHLSYHPLIINFLFCNLYRVD